MVEIKGGVTYRIGIDSVQVGNGVHFSINMALLDSGNSCISIPYKFAQFVLN